MGLKEQLDARIPRGGNPRRRLAVEKIVTELLGMSDSGQPIGWTSLLKRHDSLRQKIYNQPGGYNFVIEIVNAVLVERSQESNG